ncbi:hypothetical protein AB0F93_21735 [Micromonospora tulbaghiae]|uniref:hypothetical protein n=1 Tax=Micromonospora TaxID=1873 RepID=UPI00207CC3EB|nr:hypothetical protein [Micromonospora sp. CPM1]MCO1618067.1 hypothetical protein [Micromonospora sp. CPM1]
MVDLLGVLTKACRDGVGKRDLAQFAALGRCEHQRSAHHLDLTDDVEQPARGVDVVRADGEDLALPESTAGTQVDGDPVP